MRARSGAGLVVAGEVDVEFAQEFTGRGVDDADVVVLDQEQDVIAARFGRRRRRAAPWESRGSGPPAVMGVTGSAAQAEAVVRVSCVPVLPLLLIIGRYLVALPYGGAGATRRHGRTALSSHRVG